MIITQKKCNLSESELISVKCKWCKEGYSLGEVNHHELNCNTSHDRDDCVQ